MQNTNKFTVGGMDNVTVTKRCHKTTHCITEYEKCPCGTRLPAATEPLSETRKALRGLPSEAATHHRTVIRWKNLKITQPKADPSSGSSEFRIRHRQNAV